MLSRGISQFIGNEFKTNKQTNMHYTTATSFQCQRLHEMNFTLPIAKTFGRCFSASNPIMACCSQSYQSIVMFGTIGECWDKFEEETKTALQIFHCDLFLMLTIMRVFR